MPAVPPSLVSEENALGSTPVGGADSRDRDAVIFPLELSVLPFGKDDDQEDDRENEDLFGEPFWYYCPGTKIQTMNGTAISRQRIWGTVVHRPLSNSASNHPYRLLMHWIQTRL